MFSYQSSKIDGTPTTNACSLQCLDVAAVPSNEPHEAFEQAMGDYPLRSQMISLLSLASLIRK